MTVEQMKVLKRFLVEALEFSYGTEDTMKYIKAQYLRLTAKQFKEIKKTFKNFKHEDDPEYKNFKQDINKILE